MPHIRYDCRCQARGDEHTKQNPQNRRVDGVPTASSAARPRRITVRRRRGSVTRPRRRVRGHGERTRASETTRTARNLRATPVAHAATTVRRVRTKQHPPAGDILMCSRHGEHAPDPPGWAHALLLAVYDDDDEEEDDYTRRMRTTFTSRRERARAHSRD